jgi:hypothetical protein
MRYSVEDKRFLLFKHVLNVSFRTIDLYQPTLIMDEADTYIRANHDELRGILNSGHTKGTAYVIRTVGDHHDPRRFSTWCAKAIALIGDLPSTLADRSIRIQLRRKAPRETCERWRFDHADNLICLRRQAKHWADDNLDALHGADPDLPDWLNDRAADNWRQLVAIADCAGGAWPALARQAIGHLEGTEIDDDLSTLLLRDLHELFVERKADRLFSADICEALANMADRPWPTRHR